MSLKRLDSLLQFTKGSTTIWDIADIVAEDALIIDTDNKLIKVGNGNDTFDTLPAWVRYDHNTTICDPLVAANENKIVVSASDRYVVSNVTLADVQAEFTNIGDINNINLTRHNALDVPTTDVSSVPDNTVVTFSNGEYIPGNHTLDDLVAYILGNATIVPKTRIYDLVWYTDSTLTTTVADDMLLHDTRYYCKVFGFHDSLMLSELTFTLVSDHVDVSIVREIYSPDDIPNIFRVDMGFDTNDSSIIFTTDVNDGTDIVSKDITVSIPIIAPTDILISVYGGTVIDMFRGVTTDTNGNIICTGYTRSEGSGYDDTLVVKYDSNLNVLARKSYGGYVFDYFYGVATDTNNDIICVGHTTGEGSGNDDALVVKFSGSDLSILAKKVYGGTINDRFRGVDTDANNDIICVGFTNSEGSGNYDTLVVKFSGSDLSILARKVYGGTSPEYFYGVATDTNNDIICAGNTYSEGSGNGDALVVKFSGSDLSILAKKVYGGTGIDLFFGVVTDSSGNIICAGQTTSEGSGDWDTLVVKFDPNLNILAKKIYGGTGTDEFRGVTTDSNNNITCVGWTSSEGSGGISALVVKFSGSDLSILARKVYGGTSTDLFNGVTTDTNNNIICAGYTASEGAGSNDALVVKFPSDIPTGTFVGTVLTNLTLADSNLTLADSALALADSALALADSNLTLTDSNLTLTDSNLTQESDIIVL
jgi:hypothetical protein